MKADDLIMTLIKKGEGRQMEFKEALNKDVVAREVCGFLNTEGGQVLIGVKDRGRVSGIKNADAEAKSLNQLLINNIVPEAPITVSVESVENKKILLVEVLGGSKKPYVFKGSIYYRIGEQTVQASAQEIASLIHNNQRAGIHWERQAALGVEIEDLDTEEIRKTIQQLSTSGRGKGQKEDVMDFLSRYGLYQNGNLTNAAVVLFAKEPARYIPQCRVRLTVYSSSKTGVAFDYDRLLEGNLFNNIDNIIQFFETNIGLTSQFEKQKWQRIDKPRYPIQALREGVLNALIHRDYSNISGSATISIYPDKLEITNYGELPKELKTSDLKRNHLSLPRNPDIAHVSFLRGWIEKIGRGTLKIVEDCKEAGMREPRWISKSGFTTLTFFGAKDRGKQVSTEDMNERQLKLVRAIEPGQSLTIAEYLKFIGLPITDRSARNDLALVVQGGWFKKQGKGRNTCYVRTEQRVR